jgi:hypothetical protein
MHCGIRTGSSVPSVFGVKEIKKLLNPKAVALFGISNRLLRKRHGVFSECLPPARAIIDRQEECRTVQRRRGRINCIVRMIQNTQKIRHGRTALGSVPVCRVARAPRPWSVESPRPGWPWHVMQTGFRKLPSALFCSADVAAGGQPFGPLSAKEGAKGWVRTAPLQPARLR